MELLVVRRTIAEDREAFARSGKDDAERPSTSDGRQKFKRGVRGLERVVASIDLLASSPLVRAVETAAILHAVHGIHRVVRLKELAPDADPASLVRCLARQRGRKVVAVVATSPTCPISSGTS